MVAPSYSAFTGVLLVDIVEPIDNVEKGKNGGEDHSRPLVHRVYVSQVGDCDLQLGRAPP